MSKTNDGWKFHYFSNGVRRSQYHGGIVVAGTYLNKGDNSLFVSFAFCSPKDTFKKAVAHNICKGRCENGSRHVVNFTGSSFVDSVNLFNTIPPDDKPNFCRRWKINPENGSVGC